MNFGVDAGDILTISQLAVKVSTAYKGAPDNYKHIAEEVEELLVLIDGVDEDFKNITVDSDDYHQGQQILKSCQCVLEDLEALIEKYKSLASPNERPVFQKVKLGSADIATLRARLVSNTVSLNSFIQRFDISTITLYIMLISEP